MVDFATKWDNNKIVCKRGYSYQETKGRRHCIETKPDGTAIICPHSVINQANEYKCHARCLNCDFGEYISTSEGEFCNICSSLASSA